MLFFGVLAMLNAADVPTGFVTLIGWTSFGLASAGMLRFIGPSIFAGTLIPSPSATCSASPRSTCDSR